MDEIQQRIILEDEIENLREKLNEEFIKYIELTNREDEAEGIALSRKLDDVIVSYIKISNKSIIKS